MLDTKELSKSLAGVVGLYAGFLSNPDLPAAVHANPEVYLSDAHKLLRPEILSALGPNLAKYDFAAYSQEKPYNLYDLVWVTQEGGAGKLYESLASNNSGHDVTDADYWQETSLLSAWYSRIERGAINKLARALAQNPPAPALLQLQPLYNKEANLQGAINKAGRFVGHRLRIKGRNTAFLIGRLGLQLTGGGTLTNMPIYLFHSEQAEPIGVFYLSGTVTGRSLWVDVNQYLYWRRGGYYTIGYFETDLPMGVSAVGAQRGFSVGTCSSCLGVDFVYAQNRVPFVHIQPIYVMGNLTSGVQSWVDESEVSLQTWGINLTIEARCDVTQTLLINRDMLTNALLHVIACDVLEEISTSDRINGTAAQFKSQAYVALYGQSNSKTDFGLSTAKNKLITDLKAVMAKQSPTCMPSEAPRKGIRFASMFDDE
ncbi:hypothetical protein [Spirosoma foliorum]|uniref:Uncharacterized protein n=1 Tax=Spirosoma foliorum TaxID=2710596 RepID=A0A7G5H5I2_9BACT|nr:hypothetical protein [Spirosoma foliorum]QMW06374.1 hypothetical protein H3H32_16525 [Spirosoma foliorum]